MRRAPEPVQAYVAFWVNPDLVWLLVPAFCVVNDAVDGAHSAASVCQGWLRLSEPR